MLRIPRILVALALLAIASMVQARNEDFSVDLQPLFPRLPEAGHETPVRVTIENKGPDARGAIEINGSIHTTYPVDLPRGSKKQLIIYANAYNGYGDSSAVLNTTQCHIEMRIPEGNYSVARSRNVLLVTDTPGEMSFLRRDSKESNSGNVLGIQDEYMKPDGGPDRATGFRGFAVIVLGTGSERLPDAQVAALRRWTMAGGTLVFVGGASSPILSDPRWNGLRPGQSYRLKTTSDRFLFGAGTAPLTKPITLLVPDASALPDTDHKWVYQRSYGIGRALYLAFNPFEGPMALWDGRTELMDGIVASGRNRAQSLLQTLDYQDYEDYSSYSSYSSSPGMSSTIYSPSGMSGDVDRNPFQTTLPEKSSIAGVLLVYLVVVGPLNFFILARMKKGEWAWLTAPIISVAAAGVLFSSASKLYSAKTATSTQGILVAQQGADEGYFVGSSQMFFPSGGSVDLGLQGVESINVGYSAMDRFGTPSEAMEAVDVGEVKMPSLRNTNLSFKQMSYRQHLPLPRLVDVKFTRAGDKVQCTIRNVSTYRMEGLQLGLRGHVVQVGELAPGQSGTYTIDLGSAKASDGNPQGDYPGEMSSFFLALSGDNHTGMLGGLLIGFRPGPNIGDEQTHGIQMVVGLDVPNEVMK